MDSMKVVTFTGTLLLLLSLSAAFPRLPFDAIIKCSSQSISSCDMYANVARVPKWKIKSSENKAKSAEMPVPTSPMEQMEITVEADLKEKIRIDAYISNKYTEYSRSQVGNMCELGRVQVNGKKQDKSYKISANDLIVFSIISKQVTKVEPENIPLDIIFEDEHILAINKPKGMVVHPAVGSPNGTFVNALLYHLGAKKAEDWFVKSIQPVAPKDSVVLPEEVDDSDEDSEENTAEEDGDDTRVIVDLPETPEAARASPLFLRPGIVHRLDKGTTGVLLAAKHPTALTKVSKLFAKRKVRKTYIAICVGHPGDTTIAEPLARSPKNRQIMTVWDGPEGKLAVTHTRTLCFDGKLSVVLVRIETGRTHQIRVHLQHRRTPILGDDTYGNHEWNKRYLQSHRINRPLLHAYETQFVHPFTQESITLQAPLPEDFQQIISKISKNTLYPPPPPSQSHQQYQQLQILDPHTQLLIGSTDVAGRVQIPMKNYYNNDNSRNNKEYEDDYDDEEDEDYAEDDEDEEREDDEDEEWDEDGNLIIQGRGKSSQRVYRSLPGGTPIIAAPTSASNILKPMKLNRLYVPSERLRLENDEDSWMKVDLPEDESFFR